MIPIGGLLVALIIVAIVQGVLEWLPVSSEAFLFFVLLLFNVPPELALVIAIMFHLPTGLAAITYYHKEYYQLIKDFIRLRFSALLTFVIVATLFTAVVAVPLYFILRIFLANLENLVELSAIIVILLIGLAMLITGSVAKKFFVESAFRRVHDATYKDSIMVGLAQGFSIIPGVSRSGVTIATLIARKFDKEDSLTGSFILGGIISIFAFIFLVLAKDINISILFEPAVIISMVITYVISILSINYLLRIARALDYPLFLRMLGIIIIGLSIIAIFIIFTFK